MTRWDDSGQGSFFGGDTLAEARRRVKALLDEGSVCPCCDQYAKRYVRAIYSTQAMQLIRLYRMNSLPGEEATFYHRTQVTPRCNNGDLVFLRHWDLLEVEPNEDPAKKDSGNFRITPLGRFARISASGRWTAPIGAFKSDRKHMNCKSQSCWAQYPSAPRRILD
jgi:queuine/archaeosine tRNA-ribosyltransferase